MLPTKPPPAAKPDKPRRISKKIRAAVSAMVSGEAKSITDAAKVAGLSREHLSRELSRPHIAEFLHGKVLKNLTLNSARAGVAKLDLLDCDNQMVRDRASSFILGLSGIAPQANATSVNINLEIKAGYVIDLSEDPKPRVIENGGTVVSG